ncbi:DUF998 domain-containing protein [Actinomycetospora sp.]|uniref:DUF998 domain-containing protein n=1 Tax=Actinomycetospora sp. TaxID=1872135 RepID=UPI002F40CCE7
MLLLSAAAPAVFLVGLRCAEACQRPGAYHPAAQTVSTLAGRGASDPWVMAGTMFGIGVAYVVVAAGLRGIPRLGRGLLGVGAASVIGTALAPQPAHGSSTVHMTAMVIGCLAFACWPLALAVDRGLDPRLRRGLLTASAAIVTALAWLCAQACVGGRDLGVAERVLILAQTVPPMGVAAAVAFRAGGWRWPSISPVPTCGAVATGGHGRIRERR